GLAVGDAPQLVPDAGLERGAVRAQREGELLQLAREVRRQLLPRLGEGGVVTFTEGLLVRAAALLGHVEATQDAAVVGDGGQRAVGADDPGVLLHGLLFTSADAGLIRACTGSYGSYREDVDRVAVRRPQVLARVGPPGPPGRRA